MSRVAVIGERVRTGGFALAGALVCPAETSGQVQQAWDSLPADVVVAVLTPRAAAWLADRPGQRPGVLTVVMPP